ncbi:MAG: hypothetical protein U9Q73_00360 [Nanoarchaeota archaeon]|nr:hypothetical protein [Nanoarchaeota archaeon]
MVKKKNNKLLIGILIAVLAFVSIFSVVYFGDDTDGTTLSVSSYSGDMPDDTPLDFCNSVENCNSYLIQQGMPSNFLQERGYIIYCQNGDCYFKKI